MTNRELRDHLKITKDACVHDDHVRDMLDWMVKELAHDILDEDDEKCCDQPTDDCCEAPADECDPEPCRPCCDPRAKMYIQGFLDVPAGSTIIIQTPGCCD